MRASEKFEMYNHYFSGFEDIQHSGKRLQGIAKILSYMSVILPVIFKYLEIHYKNINAIYQTFDTELNLKTNQIFTNSFNINQGNNSINYLLEKVEIIDKNNILQEELQLEKERFQKGFCCLTLKNQENLFRELTDKNLLAKGMELIPRDVDKLQFRVGSSLVESVNVGKRNEANALIFLEKLGEFNQLKTVVLHLEGLGTIRDKAEKILKDNQLLKEAEECHYKPSPLVDDRDTLFDYHSGISMVTGICTAVSQLRKMIAKKLEEENPCFSYSVYFDGTDSLYSRENGSVVCSGDLYILRNNYSSQ